MVYIVVRILVIAACCTAAGLSAMHMLQAQRYQIPSLRKGLQDFYGGLMGEEVMVAVGAAVLNWYLPVILSFAVQKQQLRENICNWLMLVLFIGVSALIYFQKKAIPQRKPFGFTRRIARLMGCTFFLNLVGAILLNLIALSPYLVFAAADIVVLLAALIMRPIEDKINAKFYNSARQKLLAAKNLVRIGITGSYGKTECKLILKTILSEKYRVLATPPSFSTVMGISRVVNEQLKPGHQVFIAEMGAQQKGEVREMAKLVRPQYGVLTCVGREHMDTFGSIEAAAQTKFELIQSLREGGMAFFGSDGSYGDRLYGLCKTEKYRCALGGDVESYMHAEDVETGVRGTRFRLVCADGEQAWVQVKLLGNYSVRNVTLCAAVARKMGMTMEEIVRGIEKIRPIRHHLQLIPGEINVIDDSENTLPEAAAEALRVLYEFPGRRILVTSGLPDGEKDADDRNYAFGTQIATSADYVILVSPEDTRQVMKGMMELGFPKSSVRMVSDETDAARLVQDMAKPGDTVLYEGIFPEDEDEEE